MKLIIEFDYGWFGFSLKDYLFPVNRIEKELHQQGKSDYYWRYRLWQIFAWIFFPATIITSLADSLKIYKTKGV